MIMRKKGITLIFLLLLALLYAALNWSDVFRVVGRIPIIGWLVEYNIPPDDFYVPLDKTPLRSGYIKLEFTCKYRGRHEIRIQGVNSTLFWESNVGMDVAIRNGNGRVLYRRDDVNSRIMGGANGNYNYCYGIFNAPEDVPLGAKLTADITCYDEVGELQRHFPAAEIVVVKVFDK